METASSRRQSELAYFHCPMTICSSTSILLDVNVEEYQVKLGCSLGHIYWVHMGTLQRVESYWPEPTSSTEPVDSPL